MEYTFHEFFYGICVSPDKRMSKRSLLLCTSLCSAVPLIFYDADAQF